jgi:hypothetical protein
MSLKLEQLDLRKTVPDCIWLTCRALHYFKLNRCSELIHGLVRI